MNLTPEVLWVFVGQAGTAIAGLVGVKLLTHVLDPFEFGRLALANTIVALVGTNFFGSFGQGLMRFWAISKGCGGLELFYAVSSRIVRYIGMTVLLATGTIFFILNTTKNSDWSILITLSLIVGAISGVSSLRISIFTAARLRRRTAILNISNTFLRPLIAFFLIVLVARNANLALVGYLAAAGFVFLAIELLFSQMTKNYDHHLKSAPQVNTLDSVGKDIFLFSSIFIIWGFFGWIKEFCDRWALQTFYGSDIVACFSIVSLLAIYPITFSSSFLTNLFLPIAFEKAGGLSQRESLFSATKILTAMILIYMVGAIILVGLFAVFHRPLVLLISNNSFSELSWILPWLTTVLAIYQLGEMLASFGALTNRLQLFLIPKMISSFVAAISIFYLSAHWGAKGIVWGFAFAAIIYTPWCFFIVRKLKEISPKTNYLN